MKKSENQCKKKKIYSLAGVSLYHVSQEPTHSGQSTGRPKPCYTPLSRIQHHVTV